MASKRHRSDEAEATRDDGAHEATRMIGVDSGSLASDGVEVVLVEPFYGGSHKQLVDLLVTQLLDAHKIRYTVCSLPARKWHWRLMASSLYFSEAIPRSTDMRVLFVTAMTNLAELLGLRPDLARPQVRKIYYFHENQLTYPYQVPSAHGAVGSGQESQRRSVAAEDFQIGWSQILSCLAADTLVFNSEFNRSSFLSKVDAFINKIPEQELRIHNLAQRFLGMSTVLYFPLQMPPQLPALLTAATTAKPKNMLTILWNHRWEYDKNPQAFFDTLHELDVSGIKFQVVVLGEAFQASPNVFREAKSQLEASDNATILHWGFAPSRTSYFELLTMADVVVSTSNHEFFGVSVLEAVLCGCYPLVPNRLVYPEFFDRANVYNTQRQLFKKLKYLCGNPAPARSFFLENSSAFKKFTWEHLAANYEELLLGSIIS